MVVWFQNEDKYSIVEIKNIIEKDPKEKEMVTVKGIGSARWAGRALFIGQYSLCLLVSDIGVFLYFPVGNYSYYTFNFIVIVKIDISIILDIYRSCDLFSA